MNAGKIPEDDAAVAASAAALSDLSHGLAWGQVYFRSLAAGLLLFLFAAKGTRLWCAAAVIAASLLSPVLAFVAAAWVVV